MHRHPAARQSGAPSSTSRERWPLSPASQTTKDTAGPWRGSWRALAPPLPWAHGRPPCHSCSVLFESRRRPRPQVEHPLSLTECTRSTPCSPFPTRSRYVCAYAHTHSHTHLHINMHIHTYIYRRRRGQASATPHTRTMTSSLVQPQWRATTAESTSSSTPLQMPRRSRNRPRARARSLSLSFPRSLSRFLSLSTHTGRKTAPGDEQGELPGRVIGISLLHGILGAG
jgi:hypothetical protein